MSWVPARTAPCSRRSAVARAPAGSHAPPGHRVATDAADAGEEQHSPGCRTRRRGTCRPARRVVHREGRARRCRLRLRCRPVVALPPPVAVPPPVAAVLSASASVGVRRCRRIGRQGTRGWPRGGGRQDERMASGLPWWRGSPNEVVGLALARVGCGRHRCCEVSLPDPPLQEERESAAVTSRAWCTFVIALIRCSTSSAVFAAVGVARNTPYPSGTTGYACIVTLMPPSNSSRPPCATIPGAADVRRHDGERVVVVGRDARRAVALGDGSREAITCGRAAPSPLARRSPEPRQRGHDAVGTGP